MERSTSPTRRDHSSFRRNPAQPRAASTRRCLSDWVAAYIRSRVAPSNHRRCVASPRFPRQSPSRRAIGFPAHPKNPRSIHNAWNAEGCFIGRRSPWRPGPTGSNLHARIISAVTSFACSGARNPAIANRAGQTLRHRTADLVVPSPHLPSNLCSLAYSLPSFGPPPRRCRHGVLREGHGFVRYIYAQSGQIATCAVSR